MANWLPQALRSGFKWNVAVMYLRWSEPYRPHCQWHNCDNWAGIEIHWLANFWQFRPHRPVEEQTLKQVLMRCHYNASSMFLVDSCTEYFNFFCKEICELHFKAGGQMWIGDAGKSWDEEDQLLWRRALSHQVDGHPLLRKWLVSIIAMIVVLLQHLS